MCGGFGDGNGFSCSYCRDDGAHEGEGEEEMDFEHDPLVHALFPDGWDEQCAMCGGHGDGELVNYGDNNGFICSQCRSRVRDNILSNCGGDREVEPDSEPEPPADSDDPEQEPEPPADQDHDEEHSHDAKRRRLD
jgi:hypothetical protein